MKKQSRHSITLMELAARLDVATDTVRGWRRQPGFPMMSWHVRGGRCYVDADAIVRWLKSRPAPIRSQPARWRRALGLPLYAKYVPTSRQVGGKRSRHAGA